MPLLVPVLGLVFSSGHVRAATATTSPSVATSLESAATGPHRDADFHVDMKQAVTFLASDELEGRMVGTPGADRAAAYVADGFSKLGLQPLPGLKDYFQSFSMQTRVDPDPVKTMLVIGDRSLRLHDDFVPLRASGNAGAKGAVVFVGYGISDLARHYDDYADIDVKGKIALMMRFEPQDKDGKSRFSEKGDDWSVDATIPEKVRHATDHGAVGVILVNSPLKHDDEGLIPYSRPYPFGSKVPVVQITVAEADAILRSAGQPDLKSLEMQIDQENKPHSTALGNVSGEVSTASKATTKPVENVAGMLPGTGPMAEEYVVIGAHYDHLGHGGAGSLAPWSHGIHHGADDNASGTALMMELADRFSHLGPQPRTLVFVAFTGEEEGLIGSQHFVGNTPIQLNKIVAMLNLDMVGRLSGEKLLIGGEGTANNFVEMIQKEDEGLPLKIGEFGKGGIGPSDHTSFALHKIPVLFFFTGLHMDYHRPTDTADKINYAGMNEVADLGERVVKALAVMRRQQYVSRYDASGLLQMNGPTSGPADREHSGARPSMGAIPDYGQGEDVKGGMRIGGIMPGSPADKAGLKQNDLIVEFNGTKIDNMMDYTAALGNAKAGQTVTVKYSRDGKTFDVQATLARKKD